MQRKNGAYTITDRRNPAAPAQYVRGHWAPHLNSEDGAFAERIAAKADIAYQIPENMEFEEAATLSLGILTVGQAFSSRWAWICR
jgi:NADPH:quinone reductase-like Zn-dependent oxidoreductase